MLHFTRSWSGRSLTHIPSGGWATKTISTQTEEGQQQQAASNSLKRLPRWKRTSRLRKSIAVMETTNGRAGGLSQSVTAPVYSGIVNPGFSNNGSHGGLTVAWPQADEVAYGCNPRIQVIAGRSRQLYSTSDLPDGYYPPAAPPIRGCSSVDNLLDREHHRQQEDFMLKYRQVSGDLRSSCDLVELARKQELETRDKSFIESKAVRKEKRKKRWRNMSADRLIDERSAASWGRHHQQGGQTGHDDDGGGEYDRLARHCYVNPGLVSSPLVSPGGKENQAPLAHQEICDLSPVVPPGSSAYFNRHSKYNASYRLATNPPATPAHRQGGQFPRTSTQISLDPALVSCHQQTTKHHLLRSKPQLLTVATTHEAADDCLYVRAEPYLCNNSEASRASTFAAGGEEALYTRPGPVGPLQRYTVSGILGGPCERPEAALHRHSAARMSRSSQATVDSGRYSDLRHVF